MIENVAVLVVSCDKYSDIWDLFFNTFEKYWADCPYPIYLGANNKIYNRKGVIQINIGEDLSYSENLAKMMDCIDAEHIIIWVDDLMLTTSVNTKHIKEIVKYSIENNFDYVKLLPNFPYAYNEEAHGIGRLPNGIRYQISIGIALVKKNFMMSVIAGKRTAWDLEHDISKNISKSNDLNIYSLCSDSQRHPLSYINILGKGKVIRNSQYYVRINGGSALIEKRGLQSLYDYLYYRLYLLFTWTLTRLQLYWKVK